MQRRKGLDRKLGHIETACRGANLAALASIWSKRGLFELKPGPTSCEKVCGFFLPKDHSPYLLPPPRGACVVRRRPSGEPALLHLRGAGGSQPSCRLSQDACPQAVVLDRRQCLCRPDLDSHCDDEGDLGHATGEGASV
eukprot:4503769-Pyramimonas_sp.AAC.1